MLCQFLLGVRENATFLAFFGTLARRSTIVKIDCRPGDNPILRVQGTLNLLLLHPGTDCETLFENMAHNTPSPPLPPPRVQAVELSGLGKHVQLECLYIAFPRGYDTKLQTHHFSSKPVFLHPVPRIQDMGIL